MENKMNKVAEILRVEILDNGLNWKEIELWKLLIRDRIFLVLDSMS